MTIWQTLALRSYWGALAFLALTVAAFAVSLLHFRQVRRAPYYFLREAARKKALLWLLIALAALICGAILLAVSIHARGAAAPPTPTPTATVTTRPTVAPISPILTPLPTATPTAEPTATPPFIPTATPPATPTPTPAYPLPEDAAATLPGAVPAGADARITFVAFATEEANGQPVNPGQQFAAGDYRVYFFFTYQGMQRGITWTYRWCREGECADGLTCLWGREQGDCPVITRANGSTYLYYRPPGGYQPGVYEVRVWIEDRLQIAAPFTITAGP